MNDLRASKPEMQAEFSVVSAGPGIAIYLESRGGRGRNPDYNQRLHQIIERLASVSATISEITVESTQTSALAPEKKRLSMPGYTYPFPLRQGIDVRELRLSIGRAQEPVGQETNTTGGNRTKRIRIAATPPEAMNSSPEEWEQFLAGASPAPAVQTVPVLTIVTDGNQIAAANQQFADILTGGAEALGQMPIGFQGGHLEAAVFYQPELDLWMCFEREANRFWNAFGFGRPGGSAAASIITEINSPYDGIDRRMAGAFAVDSEGQTYLVHRGKIGGGQPGISKSAFLRHYRESMGALEPVHDADNTSEVIVIGALDDSRLPAHVASFVRTVSDFKRSVTRTEGVAAPASKRVSLSKVFSPEFSGTKTYGTAERIVAKCTHGLIVNTLERALIESGHHTANDQLRDLMIFDAEGFLKAVFEVKPSWSPYAVYQAIGQLFFHTLDQPGVEKVVVLPENTPTGIRESLTRLGIGFIGFEWLGQRLQFQGLEQIG
jgi:hypothetical protein